MELFFMSPPGPRWALRGRANFRSEHASQVDPARARTEWSSLADAIESRGGTIVCLEPPADSTLTGLPYAAECGHVVERDGKLVFLLPTMIAEHRKQERVLWAQVAKDLGLDVVDVVAESHDPEAIWEAQGDIASFRETTLLFYGGRTTERAARCAAGYFGSNVELLEIRQPAFHGNMALLPLDAVDRLVVCREVIVGDGYQRLVERFGQSALIEVSEDEIRLYATNGLPMGRDLLIPHLVPPRVRERLEQAGMTMVELSMTELCEKAGGASRCLVSRVTVSKALKIPAAYRRTPTL
ncbi:MAG: arginine deiminase-related protein [Polyangiaceae bacterium]